MTAFTWAAATRTIHFGRGLRDSFGEHIERGYALLWSSRGLEIAPELAAEAVSVHEVPAGHVDQVSAPIVGEVDAERIVALGGGRVIDAAKAVAGATGAAVTAIPTTLSSAEMTWVHRFAAGYEQQSSFTRPDVVLNDPQISASQPLPGLAASSANSLAHAIEGRISTLGNPASAAVAREAERRISTGWATDEPDGEGRDELALGSLLSGWVIDVSWYGLHHVLSQTLVRFAGLQHAAANAVLLPHTIEALHERDPGTDPSGELRELARRLAALGEARSLELLGIEEGSLAELAETASARGELRHTPPTADAAEIETIYRQALTGTG